MAPESLGFVDQWSGTSIGALARFGSPVEVNFVALDGIKTSLLPMKLLITFFYNTQKKKFAVVSLTPMLLLI